MKNQRTTRTEWWEAAGAACSFAGGLGAGLLGTILTGLAWLLGGHPWLHGLGTAFLVVTIPLLIFSGYCLDWEESGRRRGRTGETRNAGQH